MISHLPLVIATFRRRKSSRNPIWPSVFDRTAENNMTSFSFPWKPSTVFTSIFMLEFNIFTPVFKDSTCPLYGVITPTLIWGILFAAQAGNTMLTISLSQNCSSSCGIRAWQHRLQEPNSLSDFMALYYLYATLIRVQDVFHIVTAVQRCLYDSPKLYALQDVSWQ